MKILYFTDSHIKGATPSGRNDVFYVAIIRKLMEIENVIKSEKVDFVIVGGDLFDIPSVSNRIYGLVAKLIKSWGVKVFVIPGNHDVFGQTIASLEHTSLGALESSGVVQIVTRDLSPVYLGKRSEPNNIVALTGQEYYDGIDTGINDDYDITTAKANMLNMLVVHGFAVAKPFHPDVPHTLIGGIQSSADVILTGHYHPEQYDETLTTGCKVLKPRSLGRIEATKHNIKHKPEYLIMEVENSQIKSYEFREIQCAPDGADIFDAKAAANAEKKGYKATLSTFTQSMATADLEPTMSTHDMIRKIAQTVPDVTIDHITNAISLLTQSEQGIADKELNGFVPQNTPVNILEVELKDFQSHKHTVVQLDPTSLNAFIGSSHSGKTAVIRAINWVLYNEPKGTDMISQWASKCEVTVKFDNGKWLTRYRTKSSSGGYIVYDEGTQTSTEYSKFSHTIPVEIFNAHQMPKAVIGKDKISLNFGMQLDGPFMLSMSGSERATTIGNVTGADVVDEAIAIASSKIINLQKDVKSVGNSIESIDTKIATYSDLPTIQESIDGVVAIMSDVSTMTERRDSLEQLQGYLYTNHLNIDAAEQKLRAMPNLDRIEQCTTEAELLASKHQSLSQLEMQYHDTNKAITVCSDTLANIGDIDGAGAIVTDTEQLYARYREVVGLDLDYTKVTGAISIIDMEKYSRIDDVTPLVSDMEALSLKLDTVNQLEQSYGRVNRELNSIVIPSTNQSLVDEIDALAKRYAEVCALSDQYSRICEQAELTEGYVKMYVGNIAECVRLYKKALAEMKVCPVCSSVLSEDKIDTIEL